MESSWRDGRVVEGARLESVYMCKRIAGSNPVLSARENMTMRSADPIVIFFSPRKAGFKPGSTTVKSMILQ